LPNLVVSLDRPGCGPYFPAGFGYEPAFPVHGSLEDFVEHRHDLEEILLFGLPEDEREHVLEIIKNDASEARLQRLRAPDHSEQFRGEAQRLLDEADGDESPLIKG
jgi:hypothetical protein